MTYVPHYTDWTKGKTNIVEKISEIYGPPKWAGCDSIVWRPSRDHVLKLCRVSIESWRTMRTLSRRKAPIAKILEMRPLQSFSGRVVGLVVQEYIPPHLSAIDAYAHEQTGEFFPSDRGPGAPEFWFDEYDAWMQEDQHWGNSVQHRWVDVARISSLRAYARPYGYVSRLRIRV